MPIIRFHSVKKEDIVSIGESFQSDLAMIFRTDIDNIALEIIESTILHLGKEENPPYPRVEILSFPRESKIEKAAASAIHEILKALGYSSCDIYYIYLDPSGYYVDGKSIN